MKIPPHPPLEKGGLMGNFPLEKRGMEEDFDEDSF